MLWSLSSAPAFDVAVLKMFWVVYVYKKGQGNMTSHAYHA